MLFPAESRGTDRSEASLFVRSRHVGTHPLMRFKMALNATRSAKILRHYCEFLTLVAWVRANSFQMKRVFSASGIMRRARKTMGTLRVAKEPNTLMGCTILVKSNSAELF